MSKAIKIIPHEMGFKGYIYDGEKLIYETPIFNNASAVSSEIAAYLKSIAPASNTAATQIKLPIHRTTTSSNKSLGSSCCGH